MADNGSRKSVVFCAKVVAIYYYLANGTDASQNVIISTAEVTEESRYERSINTEHHIENTLDGGNH